MAGLFRRVLLGPKGRWHLYAGMRPTALWQVTCEKQGSLRSEVTNRTVPCRTASFAQSGNNGQNLVYFNFQKTFQVIIINGFAILRPLIRNLTNRNCESRPKLLPTDRPTDLPSQIIGVARPSKLNSQSEVAAAGPDDDRRTSAPEASCIHRWGHLGYYTCR